MTRGFEHRLWGYMVVKIKQPDAERGIGSKPTSSVHSPSPTLSLDDQESGESGHLGIVKSSVRGGSAQHGEDFDPEKGEDSQFMDAEQTIKPVPNSIEGREETEESERAGEWQIPETVILTSESISPF